MKKCMVEHSLECMKKYMETIPPEDRDLIVRNCTLSNNGKEELARVIGLTSNALRLRAFRYDCEANSLQ